MKKTISTLLLSVIFGNALFAGDENVASITDIKEVVAILISKTEKSEASVSDMKSKVGLLVAKTNSYEATQRDVEAIKAKFKQINMELPPPAEGYKTDSYSKILDFVNKNQSNGR